jgi:hypothetical protein
MLGPRAPRVQREQQREERGRRRRRRADEHRRRVRTGERDRREHLEPQPVREELPERRAAEQRSDGGARREHLVAQVREHAGDVGQRGATAPQQRRVLRVDARAQQHASADHQQAGHVDERRARGGTEVRPPELAEVCGGEQHRRDAGASEHSEPDEALEVPLRRAWPPRPGAFGEDRACGWQPRRLDDPFGRRCRVRRLDGRRW